MTHLEGLAYETLERDLPTTPADCEALRRIKARPMTDAEFLSALAAFPQPTPEELRQRPGPRGRPFEL